MNALAENKIISSFRTGLFAHAEIKLYILGILALLCILLSLSLGAAQNFSPTALFSVTGFERDILLDIRLPRVLFAFVAGAGLALTGLIMQCLFRNPLAEPFLMGTSAGAMLFAILAIFAASRLGISLQGSLLGGLGPALFSFIGAAMAFALVLRLGRSTGGQVQFVLLAGIAINAIASSASGVFIFLANDRELRDITFWNLGSYGGATYPAVVLAALVTLFASAVALSMHRRLDALLLGDTVAFDLGVRVKQDRRILFALVVLCQGVLVSLTGMIAFIALVAPHLARMLIGATHRRLIPAAILLGAVISLTADICARKLAQPAEIPLGVLTGLMGAPFFLYILMRFKSRSL
jgi:iron complex transport system permease protein